MDEYVQEYVGRLLECDEVGVDEFEEAVRVYVGDEETVSNLVTCKQHKRSVSPTTQDVVKSVQDAMKTCVEEETPKEPCLKDQDIKKMILGKYDLQEVKATPSKNMILPSYLSVVKQKKKAQLRYHNGLVVTTKGEKYV